MKDNNFTSRLIELVTPKCLRQAVAWLDQRPAVFKSLVLVAWLGGPAFAYLTGGPTKLLVYLVTLGVYCLLHDSWRILRGGR